MDEAKKGYLKGKGQNVEEEAAKTSRDENVAKVGGISGGEMKRVAGQENF